MAQNQQIPLTLPRSQLSEPESWAHWDELVSPPTIEYVPRHPPQVALYALTLLLSSFLLFLVQPMFAKLVLPRLGGTPAVWNTCMVFFQACLLAGYAYAHFITRRLRLKYQIFLHTAVLGLPLLLLPIALPPHAVPPTSADPVLWLLLILATSVGIPFFAVSTTAPLVQRWFALTGHRDAADPYFLYAASNIGSIAALLAYPTVVEPLLHLSVQTKIWAWGYGFFALLTLACGILTASRAQSEPMPSDDTEELTSPERIPWARRLFWVALALVPSSYLLGVTTYITSDVAAVPLFWVLPLAIYLLTFILTFARRTLISHRAMVYALPMFVLAPVLLMTVHAALPIWVSITLHLSTFFVVAMVCHGQLAQSRPRPERLTEFYLLISLGGVLGGAFNALLAPLIFTGAYEYPLAIVLACLLCPPRSIFPWKAAAARKHAKSDSRTMVALLAFAVALLTWGTFIIVGRLGGGITAQLWGLILPAMLCVRLAGRRVSFATAIAGLLAVATFFPINHTTLLEMHRSFFGIHRVMRHGSFNELFHGTTLHGQQAIDSRGAPSEPDEPLTYYHKTSPIGQVLLALPDQHRRSVGVIGLGVGSLAAYAGAKDHYTFYEIDPIVRWVAERSGYFSFLGAARERGAEIKIVLGDARLTLTSAPPHSFDVLVLDAFSGDAIPLHLLTRQAMSIYLQKLKPDGLLAVHVSNLYLDLEPVLSNLARDAGCFALSDSDLKLTPKQRREGKMASQWILIARRRQLLSPWEHARGWRRARCNPASAVWTDDFSNILTAFR